MLAQVPGRLLEQFRERTKRRELAGGGEVVVVGGSGGGGGGGRLLDEFAFG